MNLYKLTVLENVKQHVWLIAKLFPICYSDTTVIFRSSHNLLSKGILYYFDD